MTERRRFFPARPTQQVPGNTVALQLRLKPTQQAQVIAAAPQPPVLTGLATTGWVMPAMWGTPAIRLISSVLPGGKFEIHGAGIDGDIDYAGLISSVWEGTPYDYDEFGQPRPVPNYQFVCTDVVVDSAAGYTWPGREIAAFAVVDAVWDLAWSHPSTGDPLVSESGHVAEIFGGALRVRTAVTDGSSLVTEVLTAAAFVAGVLVAQLTFGARR